MDPLKFGEHIWQLAYGLILDPPPRTYASTGKFIGTGHLFPHCMAFLEKGRGLVLVLRLPFFPEKEVKIR